MKRTVKILAVVSMFLIVGCGSSGVKLTVTGSTSRTAAIENGFLTQLTGPEMHFFNLQNRAAAGNVSSVTFRIRSMYVSTSTDCSNPVLVADYGTTGTDFDMTQNPTIFTGSPSDGTYVCVIVGMDDIISWRPDTTAQATNAGCNPSVTDTFDIYRSDSGDSPNWKTYAGANITATGTSSSVGRNPIYIFASRDNTALAAGAIAPHANQTVSLSSSLRVPGNAVFYSNFDGQVSGNASTCDLNGVTFGFR